MKDFALVILSVGLAWLLGGSWGHRRRLHRVKEQLDVLALLPAEWTSQRSELKAVTDRDLGRYLASRNPAAPMHRSMSRLIDVSYASMIIAFLSQMTFVPGPEWVKDTAMIVGLTVAGIAVGINFGVLLRNKEVINGEIEASAGRPPHRKRATPEPVPEIDSD